MLALLVSLSCLCLCSRYGMDICVLSLKNIVKALLSLQLRIGMLRKTRGYLLKNNRRSPVMLHTSHSLRPFSVGLRPHHTSLRPFSLSQCKRSIPNTNQHKLEEKLHTPSSSAAPEVDTAAASSSARSVSADQVKQLLQEWSEKTSSTIREHADTYTVRVAKTFSKLGSELNKATGYEEIETLKKRVVEQGMYQSPW